MEKEKFDVSWTINDVDGVAWTELQEDLGEITFNELGVRVDEELAKGATSFVIVVVGKGKENGSQSTSSTGDNS